MLRRFEFRLNVILPILEIFLPEIETTHFPLRRTFCLENSSPRFLLPARSRAPPLTPLRRRPLPQHSARLWPSNGREPSLLLAPTTHYESLPRTEFPLMATSPSHFAPFGRTKLATLSVIPMRKLSSSKRKRKPWSSARSRRARRQSVITIALAVVIFIVSIADTPPACTVRATRTAVAAPLTRRKPRRPLAQAAASYSRYSSDNQDDSSNESQKHACREQAVRDGNRIEADLEFFDEAVSGTKRDRDGLNALLAAAEAGLFNVLYFFSLSRLARESVIGLTIIKRLVQVLGIRVISVSEGVDTSREGWQILTQILSAQHERYVHELSANTFRGQAANVRNGYSNGDLAFGFMSVPVPGTEYGPGNRRVRMRYEIDPVESPWVIKIFSWFVHERRSISWITRELNRAGAPKDHRATTPDWRHQYILALLEREKYVGLWPWGELRNVRDPATGKVFQEERPAEQTEQYRRHLPELRLIDDETFARAQVLLAENRVRYAHGRNEDGEFEAGREGTAPPARHLLAQLIECAECGRRFYVGGSNAEKMFCPGHARGLCACRTTLKRDLAEQLILAEVGRRILADDAWQLDVFAKTQGAWNRRQQTLPNELRDCEQQLNEVKRKITKLLDQIEGETRPDPDITARLEERRAERRVLEARLGAAQAAARQQPTEPTREWILAQLNSLHETLRSGTPAAAEALRALLGGRIVVREIQSDFRRRKFLRGTFRIGSDHVAQRLGAASEVTAAAPSGVEEVTIDFTPPDPLLIDAERAWQLREQNVSHGEIAKQLQRNPNYVRKVLRIAARLRNVCYEDGRASRVASESALFVRMAPEVGRLAEEGLEMQEIAARLDLDRTTLRKAFVKYREDRGLPPLDGRTRRRSLSANNPPPPDAA
jgi:site-specific DNA recombinase